MHCVGSPFSAHRILVGSYDGGIDDDAFFVDANLERFEDARPVPLVRPAGELVVDGFPGSETFREISPGDPSLGAVQHRIDEISVSEPGLRPPAASWQSQLHEGPLRISQGVAVIGHTAGGSSRRPNSKTVPYQIEMIQKFPGTPPSRSSRTVFAQKRSDKEERGHEEADSDLEPLCRARDANQRISCDLRCARPGFSPEGVLFYAYDFARIRIPRVAFTTRAVAAVGGRVVLTLAFGLCRARC